MKREVTPEEMKKIELEGLCFLRKICDDNGLKYYLAFGTLIGAVRHRGFIPWDDDIDILMSREDYCKLVQIASEIETDEWKLVCSELEEGYCYPWMKLCSKKTVLFPARFNTGFLYGASIDIFPMDKLMGNSVEDISKKIEQYKEDFFLQVKRRQLFCDMRESFPWNIYKLIKKMYYWLIGKRMSSPQCLVEDFERKISNDSSVSSKYLVYVFDTYTSVWREEDFGDGMFLEFEGEMFRVPVNYDYVLRESYGEYMKLPPEEKRVRNHYYRAFFVTEKEGCC